MAPPQHVQVAAEADKVPRDGVEGTELHAQLLGVKAAQLLCQHQRREGAARQAQHHNRDVTSGLQQLAHTLDDARAVVAETDRED